MLFCAKPLGIWGSFHCAKIYENFDMGKMVTKLLTENVSEKSEVVEFPKSVPFKRKFREGNQMERKVPIRRSQVYK